MTRSFSIFQGSGINKKIKKKNSKKKNFKNKYLSKRSSKKKRSRKNRSKRRRLRKYIQKGGDKLQIWAGSPGKWNEGEIIYHTDNSITVNGKPINFNGAITPVNSGGITRYQIRQPDDTIIYIKLIDPDNIDDLKGNIDRSKMSEEEIPVRRRRID